MAENETAFAADAGATAGGATGAQASTDDAGGGQTTDAAQAAPEAEAKPPEEITYHAVEKDGQVTAIWEMQGRKHLRTIDPRSRQGQEILRLYTAENQ